MNTQDRAQGAYGGLSAAAAPAARDRRSEERRPPFELARGPHGQKFFSGIRSGTSSLSPAVARGRAAAAPPPPTQHDARPDGASRGCNGAWEASSGAILTASWGAGVDDAALRKAHPRRNLRLKNGARGGGGARPLGRRTHRGGYRRHRTSSKSRTNALAPLWRAPRRRPGRKSTAMPGPAGCIGIS
jgi:hypothetical protein